MCAKHIYALRNHPFDPSVRSGLNNFGLIDFNACSFFYPYKGILPSWHNPSHFKKLIIINANNHY